MPCSCQEKEERKEWEEKMEKLKLQFDKAAVESKKTMTRDVVVL